MTDFHSLAIQLAPELATADLRIIDHHPDWPFTKGSIAYSIAGRHLGIKTELQRRGEWSKQWGTFIVAVEPLTIGTLIHELGHCVPARKPLVDDDSEPTEEERGYQAGQLLAWVHGHSNAPPWQGHELPWIRRVLHLRYRASLMGIDVPLADVLVAGDRYGLTHASDYLYALASEPQRFTRKSFGEIDREPMPKPFVKLFANDAARYYFDHYHDLYVPDSEEDSNVCS
jgi:hypothetical protein